jgi:hypothetical protein
MSSYSELSHFVVFLGSEMGEGTKFESSVPFLWSLLILISDLFVTIKMMNQQKANYIFKKIAKRLAN